MTCEHEAAVGRPTCGGPGCADVERLYAEAQVYGEVSIALGDGVSVRCDGLGAAGATPKEAIAALLERLPRLQKLREDHAAAAAESGRIQAELRQAHDQHNATLEQLMKPILEERERHQKWREPLEQQQKILEETKKGVTEKIRALMKEGCR